MANPFDDKDALFLVLRNEEGQYSLWPQLIKIPQGWRSVFGPVARQECVGFIDQQWTDMRPAALVRASAT